jgi:hypothetical protein
MIFKNLVLQALGTIWFWFLQKKYLKKIHACVPLKVKKFGLWRTTSVCYVGISLTPSGLNLCQLVKTVHMI